MIDRADQTPLPDIERIEQFRVRPLQDVHLFVQQQLHAVQRRPAHPAGLIDDPAADVAGQDDMLAAGVGKLAVEVAADLEEVPGQAGVAGIVLTDGAIDLLGRGAEGVLLVGRKWLHGRLAAAAELGPLLVQRGGQERPARFRFHFHRLQVVEVGRVVDDRRAARRQVGEGDVRRGAKGGGKLNDQQEIRHKSAVSNKARVHSLIDPGHSPQISDAFRRSSDRRLCCQPAVLNSKSPMRFALPSATRHTSACRLRYFYNGVSQRHFMPVGKGGLEPL